MRRRDLIRKLAEEIETFGVGNAGQQDEYEQDEYILDEVNAKLKRAGLKATYYAGQLLIDRTCLKCGFILDAVQMDEASYKGYRVVAGNKPGTVEYDEMGTSEPVKGKRQLWSCPYCLADLPRMIKTESDVIQYLGW